MLSHRLTEQERSLLRTLCHQLDGVPYTAKAPILRAALSGVPRGSLRPIKLASVHSLPVRVG